MTGLLLAIVGIPVPLQALVIIESSANSDINTIDSNDPDYSFGLTLLSSYSNGSSASSAAAGTGVLKAQAQAVGKDGNANAGATVTIRDVIFSYRDTAACQPDCTRQIPTSIASTFSGEFQTLSGIPSSRGNASANFQIAQGTSISNGSLQGAQRLTVDSVSDGFGPFVETLGFSFSEVPLETYTLHMSLGANANDGIGRFNESLGIVANFGNSFELNPRAVFDIPSNVTVTSLTAGIVDNQIPYLLDAEVTVPSSVPTPASLWCVLAGCAGLLWQRMTRGKGSQHAGRDRR